MNTAPHGHTTGTVRVGGPAGLSTQLVDAWRRDWDAMMSTYLPGGAVPCLLDTITRTRALRVLDLGGGPGIMVDRILHRSPTAAVTLVDHDPVLLALARAALPPSVAVVDADLAMPGWMSAVAGQFDVVLAVMTLHYFPPRRIQSLYREIRALLAPPGTLLVVDDMPQPGPPASSVPRPDPASASAWTDWWQTVRGHQAMESLLARRAERLGHRPPAEFTAPAEWHCAAARTAGFAAAAVPWRHHGHAAIAAAA